MTYEEFLSDISQFAEPEFAEFQKKLIPTKQTFIGIRTPKMRELAKKYKSFCSELFTFPDEIYEVTFIKLTVLSLQEYSVFKSYFPHCIDLVDNWATGDSFKSNKIKKNKDDFISVMYDIYNCHTEFHERFVLVTALNEYTDEKYIKDVMYFIENCHFEYFYVHMACAWLVAELLVKLPTYGEELLKKDILPARTQNKAIQKARESFRITPEKKEELLNYKKK